MNISAIKDNLVLASNYYNSNHLFSYYIVDIANRSTHGIRMLECMSPTKIILMPLFNFVKCPFVALRQTNKVVVMNIAT